MSEEHAAPAPVVREGDPAERREEHDRRAESSPGRRTPRESIWKRWLGIGGRELLIGVLALGALIFGIQLVHPIFANQPQVATAIAKAVPVAKAALAPTPVDTSKVDRLVNSAQFQRDRQAFAADLVKTGRMDPTRADSIAYYAVRESYLRGIPPAVVFGVMLTENAMFVSSAMSNVGAVGLMQVYPKVWLKALGSKLGTDLKTDSTNLKYGIYILSQYIKSDSGAVSASSLRSGLLHYNGCVKGSNTPNCHTYPNKVESYVNKQGTSLCGGKGFFDCIAKPFIAGLFGHSAASTTQ